ncbi:DUF3231 family protein [Paenibacillus sp. TRM 82003]|nr:DUF3231 family protein [Paenibacillus sp. TRM 82003]
MYIAVIFYRCYWNQRLDGETMQTKHNIRLTASELGELWTTYMNDTMAICVLRYFRAKVEDTEIAPLIELALQQAERHVHAIGKTFATENYPVPKGFTEEDVVCDAPRLFSDTFFLYYLRNMAKFGLAAYGLGISFAARSDMLDFFTSCLDDAKTLYRRTVDVMLSKGVYVRSPYINIPDHVEFVQSGSFLFEGFFSKNRPLLATEISHIYLNMTNNIIGKALMIGFMQVAKSEDVREYAKRGLLLAKKQVEILHETLNNDNLPSPMTWDTDVTDSTVSPFSDKLIMYHVTMLNAAGIANYGGSLALSMRNDLIVKYTRLVAEIGLFAKSGMDLMIKREWLEEAPKAYDRNKLAAK